MLPLRFKAGGGGTGGMMSTSDKLGVSLCKEEEAEKEEVMKWEVS